MSKSNSILLVIQNAQNFNYDKDQMPNQKLFSNSYEI